MRLIALAFVLLFAACIKLEEIAIGADANMTCYWAGSVVWNGTVSLDGLGVEGFEDYLTGSWTFYKTPEDREDASVWCDIAIQATEEI